MKRPQEAGQTTQEEDTLSVPKKLTQSAHQLLRKYDASPRPHQLEGRFGWRTHSKIEAENETTSTEIDGEKTAPKVMCIPILRELLLQKAEEHPQLQDFLNQPDVDIIRQPYFVSSRAREPPELDAQIHPEREKFCIDQHAVMKVAKSNFTYAELFAGIGGFGVALDALGGECVFVSELEDYCRATYKLNFPNTKPENIHGDIYEVTDDKFPPKGQLDLLVGGFPCQPFSALGDQPGLKCEKGRGNLFLEIVRCLKTCQPKAFLCENVPGLLTMTETFEKICEAFKGCGYQLTTEVCSARGLSATGRKRLFFVGIRNDLLDESKTPFNFPFCPDLKIRAHDCIDYDTLPEEELKILRLAPETYQQLASGRRWRPSSLAWPNKVCETLTSHYGNAVGRGESQLVPCGAPHLPRRFSVRECARLMGFPDSYQFAPQREHQGDMAYRKEGFRMVGNAVCPPLIAALAGGILNRIYENEGWLAESVKIAVDLAKSATRPKLDLPIGCMVPEGSPPDEKKAKKS